MDNDLLMRLSYYLNDYSTSITSSMINDMKDTNLSMEEIYSLLLFNMLGYDMNKDKDIYISFKYMINKLDINSYLSNPYYKNIHINNIKDSNIEYKLLTYKPYELFVCDDFKSINNSVYPQLGFFTTTYQYPAILDNGRIWMLITPNEINTIAPVVAKVTGNVLTYGLGLGYFTYMASLKDDVSHITVIENDIKVISLFNKYILPQIPFRDKIEIIKEDAFKYEETRPDYDYIFVDIWHDVGDGLPLYKKFKKIEKQGIYLYWIEDTMKYYMEDI